MASNARSATNDFATRAAHSSHLLFVSKLFKLLLLKRTRKFLLVYKLFRAYFFFIFEHLFSAVLYKTIFAQQTVNIHTKCLSRGSWIQGCSHSTRSFVCMLLHIRNSIISVQKWAKQKFASTLDFCKHTDLSPKYAACLCGCHFDHIRTYTPCYFPTVAFCLCNVKNYALVHVVVYDVFQQATNRRKIIW